MGTHARLAREARAEAAQRASGQRSQDAEIERNRREQRRKDEAKAVAGAVYGELSTLKARTELRRYFEGIEDAAKLAASTRQVVDFAIKIRLAPLPVFNPHAQNLGMLRRN